MRKRISLLGATGSIGDAATRVMRQHPDRFEIKSAAARSNWKKMLSLIEEFQIPLVCLWEKSAADQLRGMTKAKVLTGMSGLLELVHDKETDFILNGLVGSIGCEPTLEALRAGKQVGLANKETMVMAGDILNRETDLSGREKLIPVDSEHSAIFQCLGNRSIEEVETLEITASGGPFRQLPKEKLAEVTKAQALKHPTWNMGNKITIDSATMMNKGLEVIEALHLFRISLSRIKVLVHPSSIIHSLVHFCDGSVLAQLGCPDMSLPIQYSMTYPERFALDTPRLNLSQIGKLEFFPPEPEKFRCLALAYEAAQKGGIFPAILNAANEVAVELFLGNRISFLEIPQFIERTLDEAKVCDNPTLQDILEADTWAREYAGQLNSSQRIRYV